MMPVRLLTSIITKRSNANRNRHLAYRLALEICSKSQSLPSYEKEKACDGFVTEPKHKVNNFFEKIHLKYL